MSELEDAVTKAGKRKPTRRQSGLLSTSMSITTVTSKGISTEIIPPRPASPAFGSPLRLEAALKEEEEALVESHGVHIQDDDESEEPLAVTVTRRGKKRKSKEKEKEDCDAEVAPMDSARSEVGNAGAKECSDSAGTTAGKKPKLKDVTNAPPPRPSLTMAIGKYRPAWAICQGYFQI